MLLDDLPSKRDRTSSGMGIDPVQCIYDGSFGSLVGPAQIPIYFSLSIWAGLIARLLSMSCRVLLASA